MSKKISRGLTFLALAILSLGAIFFIPSLLSGGRAVQASAEENFQNSEDIPLWTEKELTDAAIEDAVHFGLDCKVIDTADDLAMFSYQVNSGVDEYVNANIYLASDIDLSAGLWAPIGTTTNPFRGNFFGNGHSISNIVVAEASQFASDDIGLFGAIEGGSIVDLTVSGAFAVSSIIDETNNIGTLVGHITNSATDSAQVINCFDETYQPTNSTYSTIGVADSGTFVIYPSSKTGEEAYLTSQEEMTAAVSIATDNATKGYSAFYNTTVTPGPSDEEGTGVGFYKDGNYFFSGNKEESQQVRVAFTDTTYTSTLAGFSHVLYTTSAPVLRANATAGAVYALRTDYQATIASPSEAESGVVNLTWASQTINITYDFGYGTRDISFDVGYDAPWANIITDHPIERLGYQTRTLYSNAGKTTELNTTTRSEFLTYYADNADIVYMTWSNPKTLTSKIYFAAASTEDGAFTNDSASDAVSEVSVSGATSTAGSTGDDYDLSNIPAGSTVTVKFKLNAGYTFQGAGAGSLVSSKSNWSTAGVSTLSSGAYAYFPNSTGTGTDYTVGSEGGYYDAYTPVAVNVAVEGSAYTVTFTNILDNGGELVLAFGRETETIKIDGTGLEHAEASLSDNSSQTVLSWENKTLTTKVGEKFTLTVTIPKEYKDYYILAYQYSGFEFDDISSTSSVELNGKTYYSNQIFKVTDGFEALSNDKLSITLTINRLVTFIKVQIGEDGKWYETNNIKNQAPVYISSSNMAKEQSTYTSGVFEVSNATETTIRLGQTGQALFSLASVSGVEGVQIQNNSFSYVFEKTTTSSGQASSNDPAYTITIIPAKMTYGVSISYTLDGQPIDEEVAKRFVTFSGTTTGLDYTLAGGYSYSLALTQGAQTWLNYGVSVTLSDAGSTQAGMSKASSIQDATNGTLNGTFGSGNNFDFTYLPGSTNSTLTVALTTKTINVNFTGLVLQSNQSKIPDITTNYASLSLKYSADGLGTLTISSGSFTTISIENGYYLMGWYLSNGTVVKTFSNAELLANEEFKTLVESSAKGNQPTPTVTINPLVEARVVNLSYSAKGENADQGVSEDSGITAPTYTYGQDPVALSTTKYKKIGYSFSTWRASDGTVSGNTYQLVGADWNTFWASGSNTSTWDSFVTTPDSDNRAEKEVVLTASFSILTYKIAIDTDRTLNIQLGQTVSFTPSSDNTYAIYAVGSNQVNGATRTGHVVTSFTITGNKVDASETEGLTTFTLSLENIQDYISADNLYSIGADDGAHLTISTEFTAMVLKLYITTIPNYSNTVTLSGDIPEGAGGTDDTGIYVNISYGQLPSEVLSYVTVTREGFTPTGYTVAGVDFAVDSAYNQTTNSTLMPKFEFDEDAEIWTDAFSIVYSSKFNTENLQTHNRNEFYMENPLDRLGTGLFGLATSSNHFSNGVSLLGPTNITSYLKGYKGQGFDLHQLPGTGEEADLLDTYAVYVSALAGPIVLGNITNLDNLSVVFEIRLRDSIEFGVDYTITIETTQFKILKNETVTTVADQIESYYTGSSDILFSNNENANGSGVLGFKYDANGNITNETVLTFQFDQEDSMNLVSNIAILDDFAVGTHDIMLTLRSGETYPGLFTRGMDAETFILILKLVVSNTSSTDDSVSFTFTDAVDVVKSPAVISFDSTGAAYISDMVMTVAQSGNGAFNVLDNISYPFTYSFDNITLVEREFDIDSLPRTFTGTENAVTDQGVFNISNLVIQKNGQDENLLANFDWSISTESSFTVFDSSNFKEYRYETRYFTANEDGSALAGIQNAWNGNQVHNFTVSNIMVNGSSVSPNKGGSFTAQYNHLVDGQILFSIYGNGESALVISVNPETVTSLSMNITVNANASANVSGLVLYNWQNDTTIDESLFGNVTADPMTKLDYGTSQAQTTYAVFTDVTKVLIDFNLDDLQDRTLYVASDDKFKIDNPTDSASELTFAGYQASGSGIEFTDNTPEAKYTISQSANGAGGSATLIAKWNLTNVAVTQSLSALTIGTMSFINNEMPINQILSETSGRFSISADNVVVTKTTGIGTEDGELSISVNGGHTPNFLLPYTKEHNETYLSMDNAGTYKIVVTFSYNDGVQAQPSTISREFTVTVTMQKSTITIGDISSANNLTFANQDFQTVTIPVTYLVTNDSLVALTSQQISATINAADWPTISYVFFNDQPVEQPDQYSTEFYITVDTPTDLDNLYSTGTYTFDFTVWEDCADYVTIQKPSEASQLQLEIAKYQIDLKDYNDSINIGKPYSTPDPELASEITISALQDSPKVKVYFTREAGEEVNDEADTGYALSVRNDQTYTNGLSQADAQNYVINAEGFNAEFVIFENDSSELQVSLDNGIHHIYNGKEVTSFKVVYQNSQFILQALASDNSVLATTPISVKMMVDGTGYDLVEGVKAQTAEGIDISLTNGAVKDHNETGYALSVTLTSDGFKTISFAENGDNKLYIDKATLSISSITKVFDYTTTFSDSNITYTGKVLSDDVSLSGNFDSEHGGVRTVSGDIAISGAAANNYQVAFAENCTITITPKQVGEATVSITPSEIEYGKISKDMDVDELISLLGTITVNIDSKNLPLSDYLSISDFAIVGASYSSSDNLVANSSAYTINFVLASTDYTGMNGTDGAGASGQITITAKALDLSGTTISKGYDGTTALPADIVWQGFDIESGDDVSIDMESSVYAESGKGTHDITIVLAGDDSANYRVTNNVTGQITAITITLQVDVTENLPEDGFVDGKQNITNGNLQIRVSYPFDEGANVGDIISSWAKPSRVGYTVTGYSYKETSGTFTTITAKNLGDWLEAIAIDSLNTGKTATIYPNWQIDSITITITGENLASISADPDNEVNIVDGNFDDNSASVTVDYYSSFSLTLTTDRGYKITGVRIGNNAQSEGLGANTFTANFANLGANTTIQVTTSSIIVTFNYNKNIPTVDGADIVETSSTDASARVNYADLADETLDSLLPDITLTAGTFTLSGWKNGDSDLTLSETIKAYIDSLFTTLDTDKPVNLTAQWTGVEYTITFDGGELQIGEELVEGTIEGTKEIKATFGQAIATAFPTAKLGDTNGYVYNFFDAKSDGKMYTQGTILSSIRADGQLTLYAVWSEGNYQVTFEIDPLLTVRFEGNNLTAGSKQISHGEKWEFEITASAGYSFTVNVDAFYGEHSALTVSPFSIWNVYADSTISFEAVPNDNKLTLSYNSSHVSVTVDSSAYTDPVTKKTGTTATVVATAAEGYEFDSNSAVLSGSGTISGANLSEENTVLTFTWKDFTDDATITITEVPASITLSWGALSNYASNISIEGASQTLDNGSFTTRTGEELDIEITLKYGYQNAHLTSQGATISKEQNAELNPDYVVVYTATISGFTTDFTIALTAEARKFTVTVTDNDLVPDGDLTVTVSPDGENNLVFGYSVKLNASVSGNTYRFIGWYQGETLISENTEYDLEANEANKTLLESGNLEFEARFDYNSVDLTFTSGLHGSMLVTINEEEPFAVGAGSTLERTVFVGDRIVFTFLPDAGYEIDTFYADSQENNLTSGIEEGTYTIDSVVANSFTSYTINYKASEVYVDISVSVRVNFVDYPNNNLGGNIWLVDASGARLEDESYLDPSEGDLVIGSKYRVLTYTDAVFYLYPEAKDGYSFSFNAQTSATIDAISLSDGRTIYRISNATNGSSIVGVFTAEEQRVEVMFVTSEEATSSASAGRIQITENTVPVTSNGNNSERLSIVTITGANITLKINTNFYFDLAQDENGNLIAYITGAGEGFVSKAGAVTQLSDEEIKQTGFTYTSTLTLSNINSDIVIKILVNPIEYNVRFFVDLTDEDVYDPIVVSGVVYGENLDLSGLSAEEMARLNPTRAGTKFLGYFTKQLGQGTQYLSDALGVVQAWAERPYKFNGQNYVEENNYDPDTQTFTLYAGWAYEKAIVSVNFIPDALKDVDDYSISDIITNISDTVHWINSDSVWIGEFAVKDALTLSLQAFTFEGFEFAYWSVTTSEGTVQYTSRNLTLEKMTDGEYNIQAVYHPIYTITIQSDGQEESSLVGDAYIMQEGERVTTDGYDSEKEVVLVAEEKPGYNFKYWLTPEGTMYYASETSEGRWEYNLGYQSQPLTLFAVFEGAEVDLTFDLSDFAHGQVVSATIGDQQITDVNETTKVKIGSRIELVLNIDTGYGVRFDGPSFSYDPALNIYSYIAKAQDLVDGAIIVKPVSTEQEISFNFEFRVGGQDQIDDVTMTGSTRFTYTLNNQILANTTVTDGSQIANLLFGGTATLTIVPSLNYTVGNILIYSTNSYVQDITSLFSNGTINIANSILADHFAQNQPYTIVINFVRMIWSDDSYRAESLQGSGTQADPYIISRPEDMGFVAWAVNNGQFNDNGVAYADCYYKVTSNLDFTGRYWEPIGTHDHPFNGTMDLGDHSISNISFAVNYTNPNPSYSGLFWVLGEKAIVMQSNNVLAIVLGVVGGLLLLATIIIVVFVVVRKKKKKKYDELANG